MFIKKFLEKDDESSEATILISDGEFELMCYAQPYKKKSKFNLYTFMAENIVKSHSEKYAIEKKSDSYYSYFLQGKLINVKKRLLAIGGIIIKLDGYIPGDLRKNEFLEFSVLRIDYV